MFKPFIYLIKNIDKKYQVKFLIFTIILIFASILEVAAIGGVIPLLISILNPDNLEEYIPNSFKFILDHGEITVIYFLSGLLGLFIVLKNIILTLISYAQYEFYYEIKNYIEKKIFKNYMENEYSEFIKVSSSRKINNLLSETQHVLEGIIIPSVTLISEIFICLSITILLLIFNFGTALISIASLIVITFIFLFIIKPFFSKWGAKRHKYHQNKVEYLNQSILGIREIKIYKLSQNIISFFSINNNSLCSVSSKYLFLQSIVRFYLEIGVITCFLIAIIFFLNNNQNTEELAILLGLYSFAIFKIMPSVNKIIVSKNSLKFAKIPFEKIINELKISNNIKVNIENITDKKINNFKNWKDIKLENLSFEYNYKTPILSNINFKIIKGKKIGIIGKSGSGKSTFIDIMCNLLSLKKGQILVDGRKVNIENVDDYKSLFSYVSQNVFIFNASILNNISLNFMKENQNVDENLINYALKISELNDFVNENNNKIETIIGEEGNRLSGGQKQRVGIARAIYANKEILIFDEATSALDATTEGKIVNNLLKNFKNKTIIFITHKINLLNDFDEIYKIQDQNIIKL